MAVHRERRYHGIWVPRKARSKRSREELETHIEEVVRIGSKGGGYITQSEGGIPYTMEDMQIEKMIVIRSREL